MPRLYLVYDHRAASGDTESAVVYTVEQSLKEAEEASGDYGGGVIYSYEDENGILVDKRLEKIMIGGG